MKKLQLSKVSAIIAFLLLAVVFNSQAQKADSIKVYTVKWCLHQQVPTQCPDAGKTDKFGRGSMISCAVYHFRIDVKCDSLQFYKPKKAYEFYNEAIEESSQHSLWMEPDVQNVKIDSVWINNR